MSPDATLRDMELLIGGLSLFAVAMLAVVVLEWLKPARRGE